LRSLSIILPGRFVDAHVYTDFVFAYDASGSAHFFDLASVAAEAARVHGIPSTLAQAAFANNRLLDMRGARLRAAPAGKVPEIALDRVASSQSPLRINDAAIFDTAITYFTLFLATDEGLLAAPLRPEEPTVDSEMRLRLRFGCYQASPRWGGLAVSGGSEGLWALVNEFGLASEVAKRDELLDPAVSTRNGWLGFSLISFSGRVDLSAYTAMIPMGRGQKRVARGFERDEVDLWDVVPEEVDIDFDDPWTFLVAVGGGLLVAAREGLFLVPTYRQQHHLWADRGARPIAQPRDRTLSVVETAGGYVVETDRSLQYVDAEGPSTLLDRDCILLRSYPRSRRFRRLVTATVDGGLMLSCTLGDHPFPRSQRWPSATGEEAPGERGSGL
jgi:hypothetical protein